MQEILIVTYCVTAATFTVLTYNERRGQPWGIWRITGIVLSLAWPIAIFLAILSNWRHGKRPGSRPERTYFAENTAEGLNTNKTGLALDSTEQS